VVSTPENVVLKLGDYLRSRFPFIEHFRRLLRTCRSSGNQWRKLSNSQSQRTIFSGSLPTPPQTSSAQQVGKEQYGRANNCIGSVSFMQGAAVLSCSCEVTWVRFPLRFPERCSDTCLCQMLILNFHLFSYTATDSL
jgi:hypothetical protein